MRQPRQLIVAKTDNAFWRFMDDTFLESKSLTMRDSEEFSAREKALESRISEYFPMIDPLVAEPVFYLLAPQGVYSRSVMIAPSQFTAQLVQHMCGLLDGIFVDFRLMLHFEDASSSLGAVVCFHSKIIVHPDLWAHVNEEPTFFGSDQAWIVDADSDGYRTLNTEKA